MYSTQEPTLPENEFDTWILHIGVNNVLKLGSNNDTVWKDIINIANQSKNFVVKQIILSGLRLTTRLNASFIKQLNISIKVLCQKHGYRFIHNSNVSSENIWKDGLHLRNSGKDILLNNYVVMLNDSYFSGPSFTQ